MRSDVAAAAQGELLRELQEELTRVAVQLGSDGTLDILFLVFLRRHARFGFFNFGPITLDVRLIEDIVERTARPSITQTDPGGAPTHTYGDDYVRFTRVLMEEVRRSGRRRIDDLHFLLAFVRVGEGVPGRVFGELGTTPEQVEEFARRQAGGHAQNEPERLYSPEEAAAYLGVHVQTVRAWIRAGRLPARRLTGQRALRIRASDLERVLEPVEPSDAEQG